MSCNPKLTSLFPLLPANPPCSARPWGANETKAKTWVLKVDKTTGDWDTSTQWWSEAGSLTEKRGDLGVVVAGGKAIAYGGFTHVNQYTMPLATVEIYDSKSNTWWVVRYLFIISLLASLNRSHLHHYSCC